MRQVAEDVSAHSAVEEEWSEKEGSVGPISYIRNKLQTSRLRSAAEEVAKKNFPEEERQHLAEAVMEAFKSGELDKGLKEMSWEEKQRYLLTTMQHMQDLRSLRSAAEEVAKKNFPEKEERQYVTEAVMEAFKNGELDKGLEEMSREGKERYLLTTMQTMREEDLRSLRSAAKKVAKRFPWKERAHLTEAVMEAFEKGELDKDRIFGKFVDAEARDQRRRYLFGIMNALRELPVAASAVKFCSELFREAHSRARADQVRKQRRATRAGKGARAEKAEKSRYRYRSRSRNSRNSRTARNRKSWKDLSQSADRRIGSPRWAKVGREGGQQFPAQGPALSARKASEGECYGESVESLVEKCLQR